MTELHHSRASLRLFGDDLIPEEITELLGTQPSAWERKGGLSQPNAGGKVFVARRGGWRLCASRREPADLDAQVAELLGQLTTDLEVWRGLASRFKVDLFCGWFMHEGNEGISVSPATMRALADRGILLDIDLYRGYGNDDDEDEE